MSSFSVDYNAIDKPVILNIQKYLMIKNNIKNVQAFSTSVYYIIEFY